MTSQTPERELPHDYHDVWQGELDGTDEAAIKEAQAAPERGVEEADIKIATIIHDGKAYGTSVNEITAQVLEVHHHQLQKAREEERERIRYMMSKRRAELLEDFDKDICEIGGFTQQAYNIAMSYLKHAMTLPRLQMRVDHSELDQDNGITSEDKN